MDHSVEVEPEPQPDDGSIGLESFQKWTSLPTLPNETGQQPKESRFPSKKRVTEKIHLWVGEIWRVNTDCIVNTTSENFAERGGVSADIFRVAGPQLAAECSTLEGCRTGEAKLTASYGLPCKAVIHTVGPKYNIKYKTAAENALHHCYFHCLEEMVEEGHRTIAFPVVNTEKKGYPVEDAAHIVIRTVRRFLERYGNKVDALVFVFANPGEQRSYDKVLPLYFPRNKAEQYRAVALLPEDVGNESAPTGYEHDEWFEPEPDPTDLVGGAAGGGGMDTGGAELARYVQLLEAAKEMDLKAIEDRQIIYRAGKDSTGLPVFVVVTKHIEMATVDLDELLMYMLKLMDETVGDEMGYTMVICYTEVTDDNVPPTAWIREVYDLLPRKYKKNLKHLHVAHPTFLMKVMTWFLQVFISPKFFNKVESHDDLATLEMAVSWEDLQLPAWVDEYNRQLYGRPARPPPPEPTGKKKKKKVPLGVRSTDGL